MWVYFRIQSWTIFSSLAENPTATPTYSAAVSTSVIHVSPKQSFSVFKIYFCPKHSKFNFLMVIFIPIPIILIIHVFFHIYIYIHTHTHTYITYSNWPSAPTLNNTGSEVHKGIHTSASNLVCTVSCQLRDTYSESFSHSSLCNQSTVQVLW